MKKCVMTFKMQAMSGENVGQDPGEMKARNTSRLELSSARKWLPEKDVDDNNALASNDWTRQQMHEEIALKIRLLS